MKLSIFVLYRRRSLSEYFIARFTRGGSHAGRGGFFINVDRHPHNITENDVIPYEYIRVKSRGQHRRSAAGNRVYSISRGGRPRPLVIIKLVYILSNRPVHNSCCNHVSWAISTHLHCTCHVTIFRAIINRCKEGYFINLAGKKIALRE